MLSQYRASNRFGLGRRFDDPVIGDPKAELMRQIGDYDPAPAAIAGLAGREAIATAYVEYREERQAMRREASEAAMRDGDNVTPDTARRMSRAGFRELYAEAARARLAAAIADTEPLSRTARPFLVKSFRSVGRQADRRRFCRQLRE